MAGASRNVHGIIFFLDCRGGLRRVAGGGLPVVGSVQSFSNVQLGSLAGSLRNWFIEFFSAARHRGRASERGLASFRTR